LQLYGESNPWYPCAGGTVLSSLTHLARHAHENKCWTPNTCTGTGNQAVSWAQPPLNSISHPHCQHNQQQQQQHSPVPQARPQGCCCWAPAAAAACHQHTLLHQPQPPHPPAAAAAGGHEAAGHPPAKQTGWAGRWGHCPCNSSSSSSTGSGIGSK
jgi:hypothetical protein